MCVILGTSQGRTNTFLDAIYSIFELQTSIMKSPNYLFDLIHALTPNEKSYFKKYAAVDGVKDKAYIKLFDILNDMDTYDEEVLKNKLKKTGTKASLSKLKEYLYNSILNTLLPLIIEKNDDVKFYGSAIKTIYLSQKHLFAQAKDVNQETRAHAISNFQFANLASSYAIEATYARYTSTLPELQSYDLTQYQAHIDALEQAKMDALLIMITHKLIYYVSTYNTLVTEETKEIIKADLEKPLLEFSKCTQPLHKAYYYGSIAIYSNMIGDIHAEFIYKYANVMSYMNDENLQYKTADNVITAFQNFFYILRIRKQYELYDYTRKLYQTFLDKNKSQLSKYGILLIDQIELINCFLINKDMGHVDICNATCDRMKTWALQSNQLITYYRIIALINLLDYYYCTLQYKKAIQITQLIFNTSETKYSKFTSTALFYQLLIHFEEGEYELASSLIKQFYRYMIRSKTNSAILKLFIEAIHAVSHSVNNTIDSKVCDAMLEKIYLPENKFSAILETFSMEYWFLSKKNKTTYYEEYIKDKTTPNTKFKNLLYNKCEELQMLDMYNSLYETEHVFSKQNI